MTRDARQALVVIQHCLAEDRFALTLHFLPRMEQRHLFWNDVLVALEEPRQIVPTSVDGFGRSKWVIGGRAATGDEIQIVCVIETDESLTEFLTLYWQD